MDLKVYIYIFILIAFLLNPPIIAATENYNRILDNTEDYNAYILESIPTTLFSKPMDGSVNIIIDNEIIGIRLEDGKIIDISEMGFDNTILEIYTGNATLELIAISQNPSEDVIEELESGNLRYFYGTDASIFDKVFLKLVILYLRISSSFLAKAFMAVFLVALALALALIAYPRVKHKKNKKEPVSESSTKTDIDPKTEMIFTRIKELDEEYLKGKFSKEFYEKTKREFERELQELKNNKSIGKEEEI